MGWGLCFPFFGGEKKVHSESCKDLRGEDNDEDFTSTVTTDAFM